MYEDRNKPMRETNKYLRRKLGNKKKVNQQQERGGKKRPFVKPSKYRKQELEDSIEEYYHRQ